MKTDKDADGFFSSEHPINPTPTISERDVVWQFSPEVALEAWRENELYGAADLRRGLDGWWNMLAQGSNENASTEVQVLFKDESSWEIAESECTQEECADDDSGKTGPRCIHVAELLFELTRQKLVNSEVPLVRTLAKERSVAEPQKLPFEPVALPEVQNLVEHSLVQADIRDGLLNRDDWLDAVRVMEVLTSMNNVRMAVRRWKSVETAAAMKEEDRVINQPELDNSWYTFLEAGYEQLGDLDGLLRIYEFYIATDLADVPFRKYDYETPLAEMPNALNCFESVDEDDDDSTTDYVARIRALVGGDEEFVKESRYISNIALGEVVSWFSRHYALEDLIHIAGLSDDALTYLHYFEENSYEGQIGSSLALTIAIKSPQKAGQLLLTDLLDADSWLYAKDSANNSALTALRVRDQLKKIQIVLGKDSAREAAERVREMFPRRKKIQIYTQDFVDNNQI